MGQGSEMSSRRLQRLLVPSLALIKARARPNNLEGACPLAHLSAIHGRYPSPPATHGENMHKQTLEECCMILHSCIMRAFVGTATRPARNRRNCANSLGLDTPWARTEFSFQQFPWARSHLHTPGLGGAAQSIGPLAAPFSFSPFLLRRNPPWLPLPAAHIQRNPVVGLRHSISVPVSRHLRACN